MDTESVEKLVDILAETEEQLQYLQDEDTLDLASDVVNEFGDVLSDISEKIENQGFFDSTPRLEVPEDLMESVLELKRDNEIESIEDLEEYED